MIPEPTPQTMADAIRWNTDRYLAGEITREHWDRCQRRLWDAVPAEWNAEVCRILVPFGGAR